VFSLHSVLASSSKSEARRGEKEEMRRDRVSKIRKRGEMTKSGRERIEVQVKKEMGKTKKADCLQELL